MRANQILKNQIFYLFFLLYGCGYNHEPVIHSLVADPTKTLPGGIVNLTCNASDDEGADEHKEDKLTYLWDSTAGTISVDYGGYTASWTAPDNKGIYSISCIVEDQNNGSDIAMVNVVVELSLIHISEPTRPY